VGEALASTTATSLQPVLAGARDQGQPVLHPLAPPGQMQCWLALHHLLVTWIREEFAVPYWLAGGCKLQAFRGQGQPGHAAKSWPTGTLSWPMGFQASLAALLMGHTSESSVPAAQSSCCGDGPPCLSAAGPDVWACAWMHLLLTWPGPARAAVGMGCSFCCCPAAP